MIINSVSLCDFRVFRGRHIFDLAPRVKRGHQRPVILFGGLNGAGKTTLLMAVRLVLYGPQALGPTMGKKAYEEFLSECIHKSPSSVVQAANSWIEMSFDYSRDGETHTYAVKRTWSKTSRGVKEYLTITDPNNQTKGLSNEQTQAFLSELIPIGLSELFFFDGEKVADLAEDQTGKVLQHAFRKLMGLDVIDRLKFDLATIVRERRKGSASTIEKKEASTLDAQLLELAAKKNTSTDKADEIRKQLVAIDSDIAQLRRALEESGGVWAQTQKKDQQKQMDLLRAEAANEAILSQLFAEVAPLLIVKTKIKKLVGALKNDHLVKERQALTKETSLRLKRLRKHLSRWVDSDPLEVAITKAFGDLEKSTSAELKMPLADLTNGQIEGMKHLVKEALPATEKKLREAQKALSKIGSQLEKIESRLRRVPQDDSGIQSQFAELNELAEKRGDIKRQLVNCLEEKRQMLSIEKDLIYKLRRNVAETEETQKGSRTENIAINARQLLDDFTQASTKKRLLELEENFTTALQRLIRKEDLINKVKIEPETLAATLFDREGRRIAKSDLSAGERQIYALAILEALTKTSGRRLPVIIDTPLGRLDSKHRKNLVENYFPSASHQVIILSTDTEVDENFFSDLRSSISHAYELTFDDIEKCTSAQEGYFWKRRENERAA